MSNLFNERGVSAQNSERARAIKEHVSIEDCISFLGLDEHVYVMCPCHNYCDGTVHYDSDRFECRGCGENGDVIYLIQAARDISFTAACDLIETEIIKRGAPCPKTANLF